jgi:hypothetical protein
VPIHVKASPLILCCSINSAAYFAEAPVFIETTRVVITSWLSSLDLPDVVKAMPASAFKLRVCLHICNRAAMKA